MKYTWLVEKYLEGELSGEALHQFELDILRKPEVAHELERIRNMNRFMREQHERIQDSVGLIEDFEDLENTLPEREVWAELEGLKIKKVNSGRHPHGELLSRMAESRSRYQLREKKSDKVLVRRLSVLTAAAFLAVLLAVSGVLLTLQHNQPDHIALYEQFFYPPYAPEAYRSAESNTQSPYQKALSAYNNAEYARAYYLFQSLPEGSTSNEINLYMGITAMKLGEFETALASFDNLEDDVVLRHRGNWYSGLCLLQMEEIDSARAIFNTIILTEGHYKDKAKIMLRKL